MLSNKWEVVMKKQKVHEGAEANSKPEKDSSATRMCLGVSTGMCVGLAAGSFLGTLER